MFNCAESQWHDWCIPQALIACDIWLWKMLKENVYGSRAQNFSELSK